MGHRPKSTCDFVETTSQRKRIFQTFWSPRKGTTKCINRKGRKGCCQNAVPRSKSKVSTQLMNSGSHSEETLFETALQLPTPEERNAFLDRACGESGALRRRVQTRLDAHFNAADLLAPEAGVAPI